YVLGALSRGPETKDKCLSAVYSRTDAHADMIRAAAEIALDHGGYVRPDWLKIETWSNPSSGCVGETCTSVEETEPSRALSKPSSGGCSTSGSSGSGSSPAYGLFALLGLTVLARRRQR